MPFLTKVVIFIVFLAIYISNVQGKPLRLILSICNRIYFAVRGKLPKKHHEFTGEEKPPTLPTLISLEAVALLSILSIFIYIWILSGFFDLTIIVLFWMGSQFAIFIKIIGEERGCSLDVLNAHITWLGVELTSNPFTHVRAFIAAITIIPNFRPN